MEEEKVFHLESSTITFRIDEIVKININADYEVELKDAKAIYRTISEKKASSGNLLLVQAGGGATVSKEVREFTHRSPSISLAEAIVVDNLAHRLMANFITKFHRKGKNVKVFNTEEEAVKWLRNQKNKALVKSSNQTSS